MTLEWGIDVAKHTVLVQMQDQLLVGLRSSLISKYGKGLIVTWCLTTLILTKALKLLNQ